MTKIMLVEDDNNLREIYEARLLAEGYEIVSAKDGEEALAMAVKEKPDLIISDVMMPKISGFDMLDILRSTPETKDTKVIMMTALSQAEDKSRADKLGADRYLVKSQVTLEDVAKVAREVLTGETETPAPIPEPTPAPSMPAPDSSLPSPDPTPATPPVTTPATQQPVVPSPAFATPAPTPDPIVVADPTPVATPEMPVESTAAPTVPIEPQQTPDPITSPTDFNTPASDPLPADLLTPHPELAPATPPASVLAPEPATAQSTASESASVDEQINQFVAEQPAPESESEQPITPAEPIAPEPIDDETDALNQTSSENVGFIPPVEAPITADIAVQDAPAMTEAVAEETADNVSIANKKTVAPLQPLNGAPPDLNALLAKEKQKDAMSYGVQVIPGATSVIEPGGQTVTPVTPVTPVNTSQPGNVVLPGNGDPSSIAL